MNAPGTRSEGEKPHFDPPARRTTVRVTSLYATSWELGDHAHLTSRSAVECLRLGRLAGFYEVSESQLPRVVDQWSLDPRSLEFRRWPDRVRVEGTNAWLFSLPSGQVIAAVTLDVSCDLSRAVTLLEDCYYADIRVGVRSIEECFAARLRTPAGRRSLLPERHQVVFAAELPGSDCEDVVQRLIYRSDLPYRKEYSAITYPAELNRRPTALAAVGPYVSVICGQQDYLENCVFLSGVHVVGSAARLRETREAAYQTLRSFRTLDRLPQTTQQRRMVLERLADQLSSMELDLSYSVEAVADLGLLVPSLRVESYHSTLYGSMDLLNRARTVGRMLARLKRAIDATITAIESVERRADERKRFRWAVAAGFVSAVAIPVGLILAFFGANAREVNPSLSMFDSHYAVMYLMVTLIVLFGAVIVVALYVQERRARRAYPGRKRP